MPKQKELEGVGQPEIKELEEAADEYVRVRDIRMDHTKKECASRDKLLELMHANNLTSYAFDDQVVEIEVATKEKIRVRNTDSDEEESDE